MPVSYYIIIGLCVALAVSAYYTFRFGMIILRMQDAIENSLEKLDQSYASISQVLQTPLFFDNAEVKKVLSDLEQSRSSVLYVAGQMASIEEVIEEDDQEID
mgnify:FL=1